MRRMGMEIVCPAGPAGHRAAGRGRTGSRGHAGRPWWAPETLLVMAVLLAGCAGNPGATAPATSSRTAAARTLSRAEFNAPIPAGWSDDTESLAPRLHGAATARVVLVGPVPDPRAWNLVIGDQALRAPGAGVAELATTIEQQRERRDGATRATAPVATSLGGEPAELIQFDVPRQQHSVEILEVHVGIVMDQVLTTDNPNTIRAVAELAVLTAGWRWTT